LGIKHRPNTDLLSAEAQLTPLPSRQLLLEYNPERADSRRNFSVCHEIAHTFFSDCYESVSQRKSRHVKYDPNGELEQLCQAGAAELLMPGEDFAADLQQVAFSMCSVRFFAQRYAASREAVLRRMVQLGNRPAAVVFFSRRLSPKERENSKTKPLFADFDGPAPKMRILYAVPSPSFPVFLPTDKSVPDGSCVYSANQIDEVVGQKETWEVVGFGNWRVEAMALPASVEVGDETPTVVALVLP
jgi:hypothetical protein